MARRRRKNPSGLTWAIGGVAVVAAGVLVFTRLQSGQWNPFAMQLGGGSAPPSPTPQPRPTAGPSGAPLMPLDM